VEAAMTTAMTAAANLLHGRRGLLGKTGDGSRGHGVCGSSDTEASSDRQSDRTKNVFHVHLL